MSRTGTQAATHVFVGGVAGFDDLASPTNTTLLRATGVAGLYMHADAMAVAYVAGQLPAIAAAMSGTGLGEIELGINDVAVGFFAGWWKLVCLDNGLHPDRANIDCDFIAADFTDEWHAYVDAARAAGIATLAPIFSPNGPGASLDAFATNPSYASIRQAAVYGGALCIDAPPVFFAQRGQAYQTFTEQELAWATQQGLRTTVILSPYGDDATFLADTQAFVGHLVEDHAVPTEWVVENYTPGDADGVGSDTQASSMAGVALWVAKNAPVGSSAIPATITVAATTQALPTTTAPQATSTVAPQASPVASTGAVEDGAAGSHYIITPAGGYTTVSSSGVVTTIYSQGSDTIAAGSAFDIIYASGPTTQLTGGSGRLLFVGGSGTASVSGGTGPCVVYGDAGGGTYTAGTGGGSILVAGGSGSTLVGSANGDVLFGAPVADNIVLEAGGGSGILVAGGGTTTLAGGSGTAVEFAGAGKDTFLVGGGNTDQIIGFKTGDTLTLLSATAVQSTQQGAWGTTLQLADGTTVILFGAGGS